MPLAASRRIRLWGALTAWPLEAAQRVCAPADRGSDDVGDGGDMQFCAAHPHLAVKDAEVGKQAPILLNYLGVLG